MRIAIFRALKLGDMLCAVPALRAVRSAFPLARISLVGLPWAREFADRYRAFVDRFHEFPGYPGLPEQEPDHARLPAFFDEMRSERFDLAIQLHGSGSISNGVIARFGARVCAGFFESGLPCPDRATFLAYPAHGLELRRLLRLLAHLGIAAQGERLEFPVWHSDRRNARRLSERVGLAEERYVCIHGGASVTERQWPVDRFARVADALSDRGFTVVLTGTRGEAPHTRALARRMRAHAIDVAGLTDLGTLAALLDRASLLVSNDTGVSHLADALRVPSVVISTGDNPERWAPIDGQLHRVLCHEQGVTTDEVIAEANHLLDSPHCLERNPASCDRYAS
jgi:ADP-heptose:LPS heptosyltransferase